MDITDEELKALWREHGGKFHGPNVETGTMPEVLLLPFLRDLVRCSRWMDVELIGNDGVIVSTGRKGRETPIFSAVDVQAFTSVAFALRKKHEKERALKLIQWSEIRAPNHDVHYTHVEAVTPLGRFLLTWKGWKSDELGRCTDPPILDVSPWSHEPAAQVYFGDTPEAAMQGVNAEFARRLEEMQVRQ